MKKLELKPILISIALIVFQSVCYTLSKIIEGTPNIIGGEFDKIIPFNIWFILPYCLWYFLIFIIPYYFYIKERELFKKYSLSYIFMSIIANIIFVIYPTAVIRPEIVGSGILNSMAKIVFAIDNPPANCFPSLHCAISFIWILYSFSSKKFTPTFKIFTIIISLLIIVSTLFIKQHVFIDAVGGIVLAIITFFIIELFCKYKNSSKTK